jgi:hypothetical protein
MPSQNRIWSHERHYFAEYATSKPLPQHGETPSLRIV